MTNYFYFKTDLSSDIYRKDCPLYPEFPPLYRLWFVVYATVTGLCSAWSNYLALPFLLLANFIESEGHYEAHRHQVTGVDEGDVCIRRAVILQDWLSFFQ